MKEGPEYLHGSKDTARRWKVPLHVIFNRHRDRRHYDDHGEKLFTVWDVYPHVDLVTYASLFEDFGNAVLEAVLYRKPVLLPRYTVYIVDIEPRGFNVVSIDGYLTQTAVEQVREALTNSQRRGAMVEKNFALELKYFSYSVLRRSLGSPFNHQ